MSNTRSAASSSSSSASPACPRVSFSSDGQPAAATSTSGLTEEAWQRREAELRAELATAGLTEEAWQQREAELREQFAIGLTEAELRAELAELQERMVNNERIERNLSQQNYYRASRRNY